VRRAPLAAAALLALLNAAAHGAVTAFTERAAFEAAIAGYEDLQVLDFEAVAAGATIASGAALEGVTFTYAIDGFELKVVDAFAATSGTRSLGLTADDSFLAGDAFTMGFDRVVHALGVHAIGADLLAGDFELRLPGGAKVANGTEPDLVLADGEAFFLGLVESDPGAGFTSAELVSLATGGADFSWNADDVRTAVAAPEPGGGAAAAIASLLWQTRRRASRLPARLASSGSRGSPPARRALPDPSAGPRHA
jgi:hypothetical protein